MVIDFPNILEWIKRLHGVYEVPVEHPVVITALTAAICFVCAGVVWALGKRTPEDDNWAKWFAGGFGIFGVNYLLQTIARYFHFMKPGIGIVAFIASCAVNLFFIASARSLVGKRAWPKWPTVVLGILASIVGLLEGTWVISALGVEHLPIWRIPDALFSAYSLGYMGIAISSNLSLNYSTGKRWVSAAFLVVWGYSFVYFINAITPILNCNTSFRMAVISIMSETGILGIMRSTQNGAAQEVLDRIGVALLIPLKLGLFQAAYTILVRSTGGSSFDILLEGVEKGRKDFLTSDQFLRSVGENLGVDAVELVYKLPGETKKWACILRWERQGNRAVSAIDLLESEMDPVIHRIFRTGEEVICRGEYEYFYDREIGYSIDQNVINPSVPDSYMAVPLRFQGAVVGILKLEMASRARVSRLTIAHIRRIAALASLAVQSRREMAAADECSYRFTAWRIEQKLVELEPGIDMIAEILLDVLSSLAVMIEFNVGFQCYRKIAGQSVQAEFLRRHSSEKVSVVLGALRAQGGDVIEVVEIELGVMQHEREKKDGAFEIGKLALVVPAGQDPLSRPTLGTSTIFKLAIGKVISNAILDVVHDHLNAVLKEFIIELNSRKTWSFNQWFEEVRKAAEKAGLAWVMGEGLRDQNVFGSPIWADVVNDSYELIDESSPVQKIIPVSPPVHGTHHIISLNTEIRLWLGVARQGIGPELGTASPWRVFLERFSDIANSAAVRLMAEMELQNAQLEQAQAQGLATVAVTTESLFHQLVNMVRDIANPVSAINDALSVRDLQVSPENADLIRSTNQAANRLLDFAFEMMNITKLDSHRPCRLSEAAERAVRLFEDGLARNQIALEKQIPGDLVIDVPFHVASLAIANLLANAKDAMGKRGGRIRILADDSGEMILCRVIDDGPGVHPSVRNRLFKIGTTTKKGSGGWGLYLVYRSLIENRGYIELTNPGPGETTFTIRFPKIRQE